MATTYSAHQRPPSTARGRIAARALTEAGVRALKAGQSRSDGALPVGNGRLVVTCTKARGKLRRTWSFRVRKAGQAAEVMLGDCSAVSLADARQRATRLIELVRGGAEIRDVVMDRPPRPAAIPPVATLASASLRALLHSYVEALRRDGKASANDVEALFSRHVLEPWSELADAPAASIEAMQVRDILARLVHMGIRRQTNVLRAYLQAAYTHGAHADLDPRRSGHEASRFKVTGNPVAFVPRIAEFEAVRDRVLTDDELRCVWRGLEGLRPEVAMTFRCAILLGGQRFQQLLRATWDDYDAARQVLQLEDSKGRRKTPEPHRLPVSARIATIIEQLRRFNGHGTYIFSASAGRAPIHAATLSIAFAGLRGGLTDGDGGVATRMQARDLRRSIETRLQALGVARDVRAQLMSHGRTSGVQQRHYERHDFLAEKAIALALLEVHILRLVDTTRRAKKKTSDGASRGRSTNRNSVAHSVAKRPRKRNGLAPCES